MKKIFTFILFGLLLSGCSDDDDEGIDCSFFDPAFPSLYIRFVDNTGANLIENGTIDPSKISVEGDFPGAGFQFMPASEFAVPDAEIRAFDNSIHISIPNEPTFQYTIHLDDIETIKVDFTAEPTKIPCNITYFKPIGANFNAKEIELMEIRSLEFLTVIEL